VVEQQRDCSFGSRYGVDPAAQQQPGARRAALAQLQLCGMAARDRVVRVPPTQHDQPRESARGAPRRRSGGSSPGGCLRVRNGTIRSPPRAGRGCARGGRGSSSSLLPIACRSGRRRCRPPRGSGPRGRRRSRPPSRRPHRGRARRAQLDRDQAGAGRPGGPSAGTGGAAGRRGDSRSANTGARLCPGPAGCQRGPARLSLPHAAPDLAELLRQRSSSSDGATGTACSRRR